MQVDKNAHADLANFQGQKGVFSVKEKTQKEYYDDDLLSFNENFFSLKLIEKLTTHHWCKKLSESEEKHENFGHFLVIVCDHVHHLSGVKEDTVDAGELIGCNY